MCFGNKLLSQTQGNGLLVYAPTYRTRTNPIRQTGSVLDIIIAKNDDIVISQILSELSSICFPISFLVEMSLERFHD